jgi:hypothetical protein
MLILAACLCASNLFADDPPAPKAPNGDQGPKITPGPSAPKQEKAVPAPKDDQAAPAPNAEATVDAPIVHEYPDVPYYGFHFGYGYRPLGYAFWPRYDHYADFSMPYFEDPYRFYRQPYQWHPFWSWQRYRQFSWYGEF